MGIGLDANVYRIVFCSSKPRAQAGLTGHPVRFQPKRKPADNKKTATHSSAKPKILKSKILYGYPIDEIYA
jgi:hypothetical protein